MLFFVYDLVIASAAQQNDTSTNKTTKSPLDRPQHFISFKKKQKNEYIVDSFSRQEKSISISPYQCLSSYGIE